MTTAFDGERGSQPPTSDSKAEFTAYVKRVAAFQRNQVADRIAVMARHENMHFQYLLGSFLANGMFVAALFKFWGPRHVTRHATYWIRPIAPTIAMSLATYAAFYHCREMVMQMRLTHVIDDFEYDFRRVHAHYVPEGITHLAWMQFVQDQVRAGKVRVMDIERMRKEP